MKDIELGLEKVHITYIEQASSNYGEINRIVVKNNVIQIFLEENTAKKINVEPIFNITFNQSEDIGKLKKYLKIMFDKETTVLDFN